MSDTREAKLAEIRERLEVQDSYGFRFAPRRSDAEWLLSEISRLESERRELQLRVLRVERENVTTELRLRRYADALAYALDHYVPSTSAKAEVLSFVNGYNGDGDISHLLPGSTEASEGVG